MPFILGVLVGYSHVSTHEPLCSFSPADIPKTPKETSMLKKIDLFCILWLQDFYNLKPILLKLKAFSLEKMATK